MSKKDGGPAYPRPYSSGERPDGDSFDGVPSQTGMTLRDYFAAKALPLAATSIEPLRVGMGAPGAKLDDWLANLSFAAYTIADAMIAERAK